MYRVILFLMLATIGTCWGTGSLESPIIPQQALLKKASQLERHDPWGAAKLYCTGAREGSIEAQYRLAMLFAFGQGVPEDREVAASLLAMAAQQGHLEASNMLETIRYSSDKLPGCVLTGSNPPHVPHPVQTFSAQNETLSNRLASLPKNRRWLVDMIKSIAQWHDVDPLLALSIVSVESNFQPHAQSNANAMGLMQLIPATAERFNVKDAFDASQNVKGGVRYLRWLLNRYHGNIELVAAAYNAGEGAVDKYKGIPPYKETRDYVKRVLRHYPQPS
ncbi:MAG: transglycosylase SLT domain-containing protein [Methylococcales bacterium]